MVRHKKTASVPTLQKRILYAAIGVLWITGVVWLFLPAASSGQSLSMKVHGAVAMVFLTVLGTMLFEHVPAGWLQNDYRPSGGVLLGACVLLAATGWGLYYFGGETLRSFTHWTHVGLGLALPLLIYLHIQNLKRKTENE